MFSNATTQHTLKALAIAGITSCCSIHEAQSAMIVSTLTSTTTFAVSGNVTATAWKAQQFTTDAQAYALDQITLMLQSSSNANTTSPLEVSIFSDSSGEPGVQLVSLTGNLTPSTPLNTRTAFSYTPTAPLNLTANTSYHILLRSSGSGFYNWGLPFNGTVNVTGPGTASANRESSNDSGGSWTQNATPFFFSVEGTAVPEPSSALLVGLSSLVLLIRRKR